MKKVYIKLVLTLVSLLLSFVMVVSVSYAWMVISKNPVASGISVTIGGGQTILLAPDIAESFVDENGVEHSVHYPGKFNSMLDFSNHDTYQYLNEINGLSPVSTADGRYWIIPNYDETGMLLSTDRFLVDDSLKNANLTTSGGYVCLDFWIVSPGSNYDIRVSMDKKTNKGSYLVELPSVQKTSDGSLSLSSLSNVVSSSARIGFLVNNDISENSDMLRYMESRYYEDRFERLSGRYLEQGEAQDPLYNAKFTIYEPNATLHASNMLTSGAYYITNYLGYDPAMQQISEYDASSYLAIQCDNAWNRTPTGEALILEQYFQAAIAGKSNLTADSARNYFYKNYLQGQIDAYLSVGNFIRNTESLYAMASDGVVSASDVTNAEKQGASEGAVIVRLEKNVPQRVRMFVWLEGQDIDCRSEGNVAASEVALKIELAGSTK